MPHCLTLGASSPPRLDWDLISIFIIQHPRAFVNVFYIIIARRVYITVVSGRFTFTFFNKNALK